MNKVAPVWDEYLKFHPRAVLTPERRLLIRRRLREFPVETLIAAIRGNHLSPHCNGENDRLKQYHGIGLILRDADHVERYADLAVVERRRPSEYVEASGDEVPPPADFLERLRRKQV